MQRKAQDQSGAATLRGSVRDSTGHLVVAATVYLQDTSATQALSAQTDSEGIYRFTALREGVYTLRAEMAGYRAATFGPCVLGKNEAKKIDLTIEPQKTPGPKDVSERPAFFDEPKFVVAGVTEAMNPGGHGSDTILRTTETLAKETVSLAPGSSDSSSAAAEESLRKMVDREPGNFDAHHRLGTLLVNDGKPREALPYLERASQLSPGNYENSYELALAYADAGQYQRALTDARTLLTVQEKEGQGGTRQAQADLHHLLGEVEEKLGDPLVAVREHQRAAELNPSETNLFDWGGELLIHRAFEPAIEVFTKGNRLFPRSVRMQAGLGVAWYARGSYQQAAQCLCQASELNPSDPNPYLFLGKMQSVETIQSKCLGESLGRFVRLQPENAMANYYYALNLRKRGEGRESASQATSLLEKAVRLDPTLGPAYLLLGILYSDQGDSAKAINAYQEATKASPELEEAHFRLAQAYSRTGESSKAQAELQLYERLSKKTAEQVERERREIQQFVYTLRGSTAGSQPR